MCREALKYYLVDVQPDKDALSRFVDEEDASELQNPEAVLDALKRVRVCDPACGSGAYLLGMMHELTRLRAALFKSKKIDDATLYERKRWIIENNLYGVDKDRFATQIACLRLWLSLAIESDEPRPLPNLDFKIECGDSLTAPAPSETEKQMTFSRTALVNGFRQAKGEYMREIDADRKRRQRQRIEDLRSEIALALKHKSPRPTEGQIQKKQKELALLQKNIQSARNPTIKAELEKQVQKYERTLSEWQKGPSQDEDGFDWAVEFAEVFMPQPREKWRVDGLHPLLNDFKREGMLVEEAQPDTFSGGFDIIVANPPYLRMELFKPIKPTLRHKWLRAGYGENLRQSLLDKQAFHLVVDFGDLPVFKATAYPAIFVWQRQSRGESPTKWIEVDDLLTCYTEGIQEYVDRVAHIIPALQFGKGKSRLAGFSAADSFTKMEASGVSLGETVRGQIVRGIVTGLNKAFVVDQPTCDRLIAEDERSSELIKPLLSGDDIRRYEVHFRTTYLIYTFHGVNITHYPAIENYLEHHRRKLENRATQQEWYELQQPQRAFVPIFDNSKIIYPDIGKETRFAMDTQGHYGKDTTFMIPSPDLYLLGVLNSTIAWWYLTNLVAEIGGGYVRFKTQYLEKLPIPNAPTAERKRVADLARATQGLHAKRRKRVEEFLDAIGIDPADSSGHNPLEQPWALTAEGFTRRARNQPLKEFTDARDETYALTEQITKIEREIDERVAALYGVPLVSPG